MDAEESSRAVLPPVVADRRTDPPPARIHSRAEASGSVLVSPPPSTHLSPCQSSQGRRSSITYDSTPPPALSLVLFTVEVTDLRRSCI